MSLWKLAFIVSFLGGFTYGYNTESMTGAVLFIERQLNLNFDYAENLMSARLWGALITIALSSWLVNRFGRKPILILSTFFLILGPGIDLILNTYTEVDIGRWITGFGLGLNSVVFFLYISEVSPEKYRGKLLALYSASAAIGNLSSDAIGAIYAHLGNWHLMLGLCVFPALLQFVFLYSLPESQVWLNRSTSVPTNTTANFFSKFSLNKRNRYILILGTAFAALTKAVGIGTLFGYAPTIFKQAGFSNPAIALWATTAIDLVQLIAALLIINFIENSFRKRFIIYGLISMGFILLIMAAISWFIPEHSGRPWAMLICMLALSAVYNFSFISVAWIAISEMFPEQIRPTGLVFANISSYFSAVVLSQYYLDIVNWIGYAGTFLAFGIICLVSIFFVSQFLIETKNVSINS